ncbi:type I restriction-modification system subunit M, partial [Patescibacteria group bacterium]|nr:type I restriction-modification system subunit M [Patescibacteria group bacterium]
MRKEEYISTADMSRILGISRQGIQKMLKKHSKIKVKQIGSGFLYEVKTLPKDILERIKTERNKAVHQLKTLTPKNDKDLEFEKALWKAADKLRGNIDASEYKNVVLGLLFLKYVSDSFYQRHSKLGFLVRDKNNKNYYMPKEDDRAIIINDKDQYKSKGIFYIPEKARWGYLRNKAMHSDIGKYIDEAMEAIENENPKQLKGVLPKIFTQTKLESHILGELVNIFSKITFDHDLEKEKDMLGRVYEYFLGQFASAEGKRGGEFFTPRPLVRLIVEVLEPYENSRVFDPACGSGGMFVQSREFLRIHRKDSSKISFFGQESNPNTLNLCKMNLAI